MALKHVAFALAATVMAGNAAVAVAQDTVVPVETTDDDDEGNWGLLGLLGLAGLLGLKRRDHDHHTATTTSRH
jgi:MYXO-CTERM domain-containing protein